MIKLQKKGGGGRIYQKIHVLDSQSSSRDGSADVTAIWDQV